MIDARQRQALRRQLRSKRRAMPEQQRALAAERLARRLRNHPRLLFTRRIGLYLPNDGEIDPRPGLIGGGHRRRLYLPLLDPLSPGLLRFCRWRGSDGLATNRYGIAEPKHGIRRTVPVWSLDVLVMPLVAFDDQGGRLGMGGGYYDRSLAAWQRWPRRPLLVGVGYQFQRVPTLPVAHWDIPLDLVLTD